MKAVIILANELERSKRIVFDKKHEDSISEENLKLLEKYEMDMEIRELSPKSIYNYKRDLIQFFSYIEKNQFGLSLIDITEDDVEEFIFYCKKQGNNTERIKRRLSSISAFYKYLRRKKIVKENPMEFIARPKRGLPVVVQTYLTSEQVEDIRKWLEKEDNIQLTTYFELSFDTMARVNAISSIIWEQIDFENFIIEDVLEKEQRLVTLYFGERTKEILLKLKAEREQEGITSPFVFITRDGNQIGVNTLREWCTKIGKAIGVETLHPHDFRHSSATLRKNAGMTLEDVSSFLQHGSTDITKRYYLKEDKSQLSNTFKSIKI